MVIVLHGQKEAPQSLGLKVSGKDLCASPRGHKQQLMVGGVTVSSQRRHVSWVLNWDCVLCKSVWFGNTPSHRFLTLYFLPSFPLSLS